jgi:hypothetical protein
MGTKVKGVADGMEVAIVGFGKVVHRLEEVWNNSNVEILGKRL